MQIFGGGDELAKKKDIANPNLLTGTADFSGDNWSYQNASRDPNTKALNGNICVKEAQWSQVYQVANVVAGQFYTFSVETSNGYAGLFVQAPDGASSDCFAGSGSVSQSFNTNTWHRFSNTWKCVKSGQVRLFEAQGAEHYIANMKLEIGTVATPWCPAYEDYAMKSDLDNKVNTDRSLYFVNDKHPLAESEIFNTDDGHGRLQAIHQRMSENGSETFGGYDNILLFGGDDITSIFDVNTSNSQVKVAVGGAQGKATWSEFVAWKSDIQRLEQEIADLKKQIGESKAQ